MQSNSMLKIILLAILSMPSCSSINEHDDELMSCEIGKTCNISGVLNLRQGEPAWASLLESERSCTKLALPDDFYTNSRDWQGLEVIVIGIAFKQPTFDETNGDIVLWYKEKDRKLAVGMCDSGIGIYVTSIKSLSGKTWPN